MILVQRNDKTVIPLFAISVCSLTFIMIWLKPRQMYHSSLIGALSQICCTFLLELKHFTCNLDIETVDTNSLDIMHYQPTEFTLVMFTYCLEIIAEVVPALRMAKIPWTRYEIMQTPWCHNVLTQVQNGTLQGSQSQDLCQGHCTALYRCSCVCLPPVFQTAQDVSVIALITYFTFIPFIVVQTWANDSLFLYQLVQPLTRLNLILSHNFLRYVWKHTLVGRKNNWCTCMWFSSLIQILVAQLISHPLPGLMKHWGIVGSLRVSLQIII